jgi:hypothetical protein
VLFVASLAIFLAASDPSGGVASRPLAAWLAPLIVVGAPVLGCIVASHGAHPARRALMLGAAAGMTFGVSSSLIKTFSGLVANEGLGRFGHWAPYVLAGVVSVGFLIMQSAFQAGDLRSALPAIELGEPVVAVLLGLALFHERLQLPNVFVTVVVLGSVVTMVLATVHLARSAASDDAGAGVIPARAG